jgi:hypothetical protein
MRTLLVSIALITLIACGCATVPQLNQPLRKVSFVTAEPAPKSFTNWTFFWFMPEIEPGAELEYIVRHKIGERPAGSAIRSDFPPGLAKTGPDVFFGKPVTVTFQVNKGTINFTKNVSFAFETATREIPGVRKQDRCSVRR